MNRCVSWWSAEGHFRGQWSVTIIQQLRHLGPFTHPLSSSPSVDHGLRACSHEPGVMIAPGQALPRVHMMICCPGSTSLPQGKFIVIWSLRIYLNSFSFYTNCYREWILNRLTYFWCFLERFIEKFILNIINEHAQDYSCPGATFAFCSHGEKLPRQGGLPGVVQLSKLSRGNEKLMWTVAGVRPCTEAKLTPGSVSCIGAMSCPGIMWTGPY